MFIEPGGMTPTKPTSGLPVRRGGGRGLWPLVILVAAVTVGIYLMHRQGTFVKPARPVPPPMEEQEAGEPEMGVYSAREMVWIPGGTFRMGGTNADEGPVHTVAVDGFWMDKYEVTNKEFEKFRKSHVEHRSKTSPGDGNPVIHVTWEEAMAYCAWRCKRERSPEGSCRLPTEAEWEYAARGGLDQKEYPWGDFPPDEYTLPVATYKARSMSNETRTAQLARVGAHAPNGFGLHDMSGSVWEWCLDWYGDDTYAQRAGTSGTVTNPMGPGGGVRRVWRGGSWLSNADQLRCATRGGLSPDHWMDTLGFRCVRKGRPGD